MMVTWVCAPTKPVAIVKLAELEAAAIVTEAGTEATAGLELDRATTSPPAGAWPLRFAVFELVDRPLVTLAGDKTSEWSMAAYTVSVALAATPA